MPPRRIDERRRSSADLGKESARAREGRSLGHSLSGSLRTVCIGSSLCHQTANAFAWLQDGKVERSATLAVAIQRLREAIGASGDIEGAPTRQALPGGSSLP